MSASSGSITQWVSVCRCEILDDVQEITADVCTSCGKRIKPARPGSFTQWIFGADSCSCDRPKARPDHSTAVPARRGIPSTKMGLSLNLPETETIDDIDASTFDIDAGVFPVDRYKPLRKIESGASGAVYLCWDKDLRRNVAVKILQSLKHDQIVGFQNEARLTAKLHHPNIVSILDFGTSDGSTPYMVLEFANGFNLEKVVKERGPLRLDLAIDLLLQVCEALGYAHECGIFHRDIKSSNIIVSEREHIVAHVIDFGVASFAKSEPTIIQGRSIVGTPAYMSPDQALGLPFDERSEIYSFGCVMYEILTGRLPFEGTNALVVLGKHASDDVPKMNNSTQENSIPSEVEEVVGRCLRKDRNDRFTNMNELQKALIELQSVAQEKVNGAASINLSLFEEEKEEVTIEKDNSNNRLPLYVLSIVALLLITVSTGWYLLFGRTKPTAKVATVDPNRLHEHLYLPDEEAPAKPEDLFIIEPEGPGVKVMAQFVVRDSDLAFLADRKDIVSLNLARTKVKGPGLAYLINNPIAYLDLGSSEATNDICEQIAKLKSIRMVVFRGTRITNSGISKLKNAPIESLVLGNINAVDDETITLLAQFKSLRYLDIGFTSVKGTSFPALNSTIIDRVDISTDNQPLSFFQSLARLNVRGLAIHGNKPIPLEGIAELDNRKFLAIVSKPTSAEELNAFSKLHLNTLDLNSTGLTDEKLDSMLNSPIRRLGLHKEVISDKGLLKLAKLPNLKAVLLDFCGGITADGIEALRRARPGLRILDKQSEF